MSGKLVAELREFIEDYRANRFPDDAVVETAIDALERLARENNALAYDRHELQDDLSELQGRVDALAADIRMDLRVNGYGDIPADWLGVVIRQHLRSEGQAQK